ncbi:MAG: hypothetical protein VB875_08505 [Pirellulales bacterium]
MKYEHVQTGHFDVILLPVVFLFLGLALLLHANPVVFYAMVAVASIVFFFSLCLGRLIVRDDGDALLVRFGPIPLIRKRIRYADISEAERSRSRLIDGWGVHYVPGRGWTYNLWGFDCVELRLGDRRLRIGTDEPDALLEFLKQKIAYAARA